MARQYFVETGEPERSVFIGRRQSYHGNTLGALAVGGNEWRRRQFAPAAHRRRARLALLRVPRPRSPRRRPRPTASAWPASWRRRSPRSARSASSPSWPRPSSARPPARCRPRPATSGASARSATATASCSSPTRSCAAWAAPARCYAIEQEGVVPDLDGHRQGPGRRLPAHRRGARVQGKIVEAFRKGSGLFQHGHTYIGHPVAAAAALAVQKVIKRDKPARGRAHARRVLRAAPARGARLASARRRHPRARASSAASNSSRTAPPSAPSTRPTSSTRGSRRTRWQRGLMVYPMGGTIDGVQGDHVLLAPALHRHGGRPRRDRRAACRGHRDRHRRPPARGVGIPPDPPRGDRTMKRHHPRHRLRHRRGLRRAGRGGTAEVPHHRHRRRHRRLLRRGRRHLPPGEQGPRQARHPLLGGIHRRLGVQHQHDQGGRAGPRRDAVRRDVQRGQGPRASSRTPAPTATCAR